MSAIEFLGRKMSRRKGVSILMSVLMLVGPVISMPGCGGNDFLGLEDYQRDLLLGALAIALLGDGIFGAPSGDTGTGDPDAGRTLVDCWDINANGINDPEEDINGDGLFDARDCRGADGQDGFDGTGGADGAAGSPGVSCWDLDGNGIGDPDTEDVNGDGNFDALDCQGADGADGSNGSSGASGANGASGADGADGTDGANCWDLNGNGVPDCHSEACAEYDPEQAVASGVDTVNEDINGDGVVDILDCQGADGTNGTNGSDGTNGTDGTNGINCWDLNGDGIGDLTTEDSNGDGDLNALDCQGADGADGTQGTNGTDGINCWDLNGNGLGDLETEDTNGDQVVDVFDCRDVNNGGSGSPMFDMFIDDFFTVDRGTYNSLPRGVALDPTPIEEPALGPNEVVAYRISVPRSYDATGADDPGVDQNTITMRLTFWREGPVEECFVFRLDAFRAQHATGVTPYGPVRYVRLDDPAVSNPSGELIVVDLPINNPGDDPVDGLCLPGNLKNADFLAFELNIVQPSLIDRDVSFTLFGVEFFETLPGQTQVYHATVFKSLDDVDCDFIRECKNDNDCFTGLFCDGRETCEEGQCFPGTPPCLTDDKVCDEVEDECTTCEVMDDIEAENGSVDAAGAAAGMGGDKVVICHRPADDPQNEHTLIVAAQAVTAHLDHGDSLGPCEGDCVEEPDDLE